MTAIVMAWELGGGLGHCVNLAPLARKLSGAGHAVHFAARDETTAAHVVKEDAVAVYRAPYAVPKAAARQRVTRTFADVLHNCGFDARDGLLHRVAVWREMFAATKARLVVCEHAPTALLAARTAELPAAVLGTGFFVPPDETPMRNLQADCPGATPADLEHERRLCDMLNDVVRSTGGAQLHRVGQLFADAAMQALLTFPELDHYPERAAAATRQRTRYWGMWSAVGGVTPRWSPLANPKLPRVFAYLSTESSPWNAHAVLSTLAERGWACLAYIPGGQQLALHFRGTSVAVSTERVDLQQASRSFDLAILHGNAGAATVLLRGGVPLVLLPRFLEQILLSRRVAALGAGVIPQGLNASHLAAALDFAASEAARAAAGQFALRQQTYDPGNAIRSLSAALSRLAR